MTHNSRARAAMLISLLVSGCAAPKPLPPPAVDHPANPDAPEVAPAAVSNTLAVQPTTGPASQPTTAPMEGAHHHAH